ncbi:MAG TPA: MBL fold metallo-hydrolase [Mycobacteriales bacterium]|nr:MBL fold metallo-hydrolase [Mycobacteriales bacterium]
MTGEWREVGHQVFVRRHQPFDVNAGLVVGSQRCLVIDTLSTAAQAAELIRAIRTVTSLPWAVVNTHAHFDHCFGNATFRPAEFWAHERCIEYLRGAGGRIQRDSARELAPELAADLAAVHIDPADRAVTREQAVDLGDRAVQLHHLGRGHTDHDLIVTADDVLFTGDLIEQGAPPSFEDSYPLQWPGTAAALLPLAAGAVVPGHGDVVDRAFVESQAEELQLIADHALGRTDQLPPYPAEVLRTALERAATERFR